MVAVSLQQSRVGGSIVTAAIPTMMAVIRIINTCKIKYKTNVLEIIISLLYLSNECIAITKYNIALIRESMHEVGMIVR